MKGPQIKALRENLGFSQKEFAYLLGIHPQTASNWEREMLIPNPWFVAILEIISKSKAHNCSNMLMTWGPIKTLSFLLDRGLKITIPQNQEKL